MGSEHTEETEINAIMDGEILTAIEINCPDFDGQSNISFKIDSDSIGRFHEALLRVNNEYSAWYGEALPNILHGSFWNDCDVTFPTVEFHWTDECGESHKALLPFHMAFIHTRGINGMYLIFLKTEDTEVNKHVYFAFMKHQFDRFIRETSPTHINNMVDEKIISKN